MRHLELAELHKFHLALQVRSHLNQFQEVVELHLPLTVKVVAHLQKKGVAHLLLKEAHLAVAVAHLVEVVAAAHLVEVVAARLVEVAAARLVEVVVAHLVAGDQEAKEVQEALAEDLVAPAEDLVAPVVLVGVDKVEMVEDAQIRHNI